MTTQKISESTYVTQAWVEQTATKIQLVFHLDFSDVSQRPFYKEIFIERENKYIGFLLPSPPVESCSFAQFPWILQGTLELWDAD